MRKRWLIPGLLVALAGCLERKETVKVSADGSVEVTHELKGDQGDFDPKKGDALPAAAPWTVTDEVTPRPEGKGQEVKRRATARFASCAAIPETNDPADAGALRARTTFTREARGEVVRYVLERRYPARAHAWRERIFERAFPDDLRKAIERGDKDPLSEELLDRTLGALLVFEREKHLAFLEEALGAAAPERAGTAERLAARAAFSRRFDASWRLEALKPLVKGTDEQRAELDARYRESMVRDAAKAAAEALGGDALLEERVAKAFADARRVLEVTEALRIQSFEVRVEMPADVVQADAERIEGRVAVFKFSGKDFSDREHVLRVVAEGRP